MIKIFLVFMNLICFSYAQFDQCDVVLPISSAGRSVFVKNIGKNCRYQIIAPVDTTIEASCTFNLPGKPSECETHRLVIGEDKQLRDGIFYCARGSFFLRSKGNEFVFSFISDGSGFPTFQCTFKSVAPSNAVCDCGWSPRSRIVGGSVTGVNEFVSHAGLVDQRTKDVFCGATIVTQFWSVTAAHCFDAYPNVRTSALLTGDHDLSSGRETFWAALYLLEKYIQHENYNPENNANDIAMIKTQNYVKFNPGVGPTCIPFTFMQNDRYFDWKFLTAVGWGTTEFGGPSSNLLKKASVQVVDFKTCSNANNFIDRTKVCTNEIKNGSCQKDSGGALYFPSGRLYLIGIISYGTFCASRVPAVNTRVTSYVGWIEKNVRGFICRKT